MEAANKVAGGGGSIFRKTIYEQFISNYAKLYEKKRNRRHFSGVKFIAGNLLAVIFDAKWGILMDYVG